MSRKKEESSSGLMGLIQSIAMLFMMPWWLFVMFVGAALAVCVLIIMLLAVTGSLSSQAEDFRYQCDSAIGPDPSVTITATTTTARPTATEEEVPTSAPLTNPYANLTTEPGDTATPRWQLDCMSAMREAPYQAPALRKPSTHIRASCARDLALSQLGQPVQGSAAAMVRQVMYTASTAATTAGCQQLAATPAGAGHCAPTGTTLLLPVTLAKQGPCGQRVETTAISSGDVVFWDYRNNAPTRVGVAVMDTHLITDDPATGKFVQLPIPTGKDVRVKRMLAAK